MPVLARGKGDGLDVAIGKRVAVRGRHAKGRAGKRRARGALFVEALAAVLNQVERNDLVGHIDLKTVGVDLDRAVGAGIGVEPADQAIFAHREPIRSGYLLIASRGFDLAEDIALPADELGLGHLSHAVLVRLERKLGRGAVGEGSLIRHEPEGRTGKRPAVFALLGHGKRDGLIEHLERKAAIVHLIGVRRSARDLGDSAVLAHREGRRVARVLVADDLVAGGGDRLLDGIGLTLGELEARKLRAALAVERLLGLQLTRGAGKAPGDIEARTVKLVARRIDLLKAERDRLVLERKGLGIGGELVARAVLNARNSSCRNRTVGGHMDGKALGALYVAIRCRLLAHDVVAGSSARGAISVDIGCALGEHAFHLHRALVGRCRGHGEVARRIGGGSRRGIIDERALHAKGRVHQRIADGVRLLERKVHGRVLGHQRVAVLVEAPAVVALAHKCELTVGQGLYLYVGQLGVPQRIGGLAHGVDLTRHELALEARDRVVAFRRHSDRALCRGRAIGDLAAHGECGAQKRAVLGIALKDRHRAQLVALGDPHHAVLGGKRPTFGCRTHHGQLTGRLELDLKDCTRGLHRVARGRHRLGDGIGVAHNHLADEVVIDALRLGLAGARHRHKRLRCMAARKIAFDRKGRARELGRPRPVGLIEFETARLIGNGTRQRRRLRCGDILRVDGDAVGRACAVPTDNVTRSRRHLDEAIRAPWQVGKQDGTRTRGIGNLGDTRDGAVCINRRLIGRTRRQLIRAGNSCPIATVLLLQLEHRTIEHGLGILARDLLERDGTVQRRIGDTTVLEGSVGPRNVLIGT